TMVEAGQNRPYKIRVYDKQNKPTEQSRTYSVNAVAQPPSFNISANPDSVQVGQKITFRAVVDNPEVVSKAEIVFTDANNMTKPLERNGNTWYYTHTMVEAGQNRPYKIRVYDKQNKPTEQSKTYSVNAVAQPPSIVDSNHYPSFARVNQNMTFTVQINNPETVNKVIINFYDLQGNVLASEDMSPQGYGRWSRTRTMISSGSKQYRVDVHTKNNGTLYTQRKTFKVI
ncbi:MAG TPA: hypothetical protein PKC44_12980, partial [Agitococcus sp.]|nr:hypothetical protein [Agitococcus sp.]